MWSPMLVATAQVRSATIIALQLQLLKMRHSDGKRLADPPQARCQRAKHRHAPSMLASHCRFEAPAHGHEVGEEPERVDEVRLSAGVRPDHEHPRTQRSIESLEVAPVLKAHLTETKKPTQSI